MSTTEWQAHAEATIAGRLDPDSLAIDVLLKALRGAAVSLSEQGVPRLGATWTVETRGDVELDAVELAMTDWTTALQAAGVAVSAGEATPITVSVAKYSDMCT